MTISIENQEILKKVANACKINYTTLSDLEENDKNLDDMGMEYLAGYFLYLYSIAVREKEILDFDFVEMKNLTLPEDLPDYTKKHLVLAAGVSSSAIKHYRLNPTELDEEIQTFLNLCMAFITIYKNYYKRIDTKLIMH